MVLKLNNQNADGVYSFSYHLKLNGKSSKETMVSAFFCPTCNVFTDETMLMVWIKVIKWTRRMCYLNEVNT